MNPGELQLDEILARLERNEFSWQPFQPGVEISRLWGDPQAGPSSALLRYAPGARVPRHRHEDIEEIRILRGSQRDDDGVYPAGSHVTKPAGSVHTVESPEGCVAWLVWRKPNTFIDEPGSPSGGY
ncbi:MAG: cupin domain-containing protein [Verrucomicrobiota bacterium]